LAPAASAAGGSRIVFVAELGKLSMAEIARIMDGCVGGRGAGGGGR
jgi:hypothetical protein